MRRSEPLGSLYQHFTMHLFKEKGREERLPALEGSREGNLCLISLGNPFCSFLVLLATLSKNPSIASLRKKKKGKKKWLKPEVLLCHGCAIFLTFHLHHGEGRGGRLYAPLWIPHEKRQVSPREGKFNLGAWLGASISEVLSQPQPTLALPTPGRRRCRRSVWWRWRPGDGALPFANSVSSFSTQNRNRLSAWSIRSVARYLVKTAALRTVSVNPHQKEGPAREPRWTCRPPGSHPPEDASAVGEG